MVFTMPPKFAFRRWSVFAGSDPGRPSAAGPFVVVRDDATAVGSFGSLEEASAEVMRLFRREEVDRLICDVQAAAEDLDGCDDVKTHARLVAALAVLQVQIDG